MNEQELTKRIRTKMAGFFYSSHMGNYGPSYAVKALYRDINKDIEQLNGIMGDQDAKRLIMGDLTKKETDNLVKNLIKDWKNK